MYWLLLDSRFRGNDFTGAYAVTPAGMMVRTAHARRPPAVIPAKAGMIVRTAYARRPPAVIPAKAGIHRCSPATYGAATDTSFAGVKATDDALMDAASPTTGALR